MIKRILLMVLFSLAGICAYAQMSDQAVVEYIKKGVENGKSQQRIATELMAKGVSYDQILRIQKTYAGGVVDMASPIGENNKSAKKSDRLREPKNETVELRKLYLGDKETQDKKNKAKMRDLPESGSVMPLVEVQRDDDTASFKMTSELNTLLMREIRIRKENSLEWNGRLIPVYGHDFFENRELSFEPNENMPTPENYVIGAGDEVIIDVWGVNEITIRESVSPDGRIYIEQSGPVEIAGLTISQATAKLKTVLSQKYSLSGPDAESSMSVTLGYIRSILVNVVGEVKMPGTYRLSSLSSVFNALYCAGGVTPIGSLRTIQIARGGKIVATADLYEYLFEGAKTVDISLKDGDAIIVPSYTAMVEISEGFKRPMLYETIPGEALEKMLKYGGGFASNAGTDEVSVSRKNGKEGQMFTVAKSDYRVFALEDGDVLTAHLNESDAYANRVEIRGSVLRPGVFALGGGIATVRQLVEFSGGLLEDAFTSRAQLIREKADRSLEVTAVALGAIMKGEIQDVLLRKNDILIVANVNEMEKKGEVSISGYIKKPGKYEYAGGMTLEDIIMIAGGLENGASTARVDISRRIMNSESMASGDTIAEIFSCSIESGMMMDGASGFTLMPYDVVAVRKSPSYREQKIVRVTGEVNFPGEYVLVKNNEMLSDIFKRAGEATSNGYVAGALIKRRINEDERNLQRNLMMTARNRTDTAEIVLLANAEYYTVGINLDKALAQPGGYYDVILRDGDELVIPELTNTVKIQGEVLFPNTVNYMEKLSVRKYIKLAGGFSNEARKSKTFVVYLNGQVTSGMNSKVIPGCEIYVPSKPKRHQLTIGEWMSIGTTAASLATTLATIANLIKK